MMSVFTLKCYSEDFTTEYNIDYTVLLQIVENDKNLTILQQDFNTIVLIWSEQGTRWLPLLRLKNDLNYISSNSVSSLGLQSNLFRLAEQLNACVVEERGNIIFIPQYGDVYSSKNPICSLTDMGLPAWEIAEEMALGNNLHTAIDNIQIRRKIAWDLSIAEKTRLLTNQQIKETNKEEIEQSNDIIYEFIKLIMVILVFIAFVILQIYRIYIWVIKK